jgi:FAD/FMN-containing dehydrogenase
MHAIIQRLQDLLGTAGVLFEKDDVAPYLTDWRGIYTGTALAIALPKTTQQVVEVVKLCGELQIKIVPQGGNTGLCGGATPEGDTDQIILSLKRLNQIRDIDLENQTITVEAGCILQTVQEKVQVSGAFFPLSLAAQGSCTIGGNLATNAGGVNVLRYGNTRDICLGIEAVLANGGVYSQLKGLRKDNTGYDLKNLLIGSEGTLGIITAGVFKIFPAPLGHYAALVAINDLPDMIALLQELQQLAGNELCAFEMMSRESLALTIKHFPQYQRPIFLTGQYTLLIELANFDLDENQSSHRIQDILESTLERYLDSGRIQNAAIASSQAQVNEFWGIRHHITLAQAKEQGNIKFDISFAISKIAGFIESTDLLLSAQFPGLQIINFGHLGDGNLHYNFCAPRGAQASYIQEHEASITQIVFAQIQVFGGSISAEHGIGQLKRAYLLEHRGSVAYQMMRNIKIALDPENLLNPNKVLLPGL